MSKCLLLIGLLFLAGCSSPRQRAETVLRKIGPEQLREVAATLYKDIFAPTAPEYSTLKEAQWPAQFSAFAPDHVGAYRNGFALALTSSHDTESGIYVIPAHSDLQPHATARARYERLADGVYWYSFDQ